MKTSLPLTPIPCLLLALSAFLCFGGNSARAANSPPTVSLTSPANNSSFFGSPTITLTASATDANGVAKVDFLTNGVLLATDTTSPYSYDWSGMAPGPYRLTARATDTLGAASVSSPVTLLVNTFNPTADAHVRDGGSANSNLGNKTLLEAQYNTSAGKKAVAYLKFDVSAINSVATAKLRVNAKLSGSGSVTTTLHPVPNTPWHDLTSGGITWNTKPPIAVPALGTATIPTKNYGWYEIDVSDYVRNEKAAGRSVVSFAFTNTAVSSVYVQIQSREATVLTNRPQLIVTPGGGPPSIAPIANQSTAEDTALAVPFTVSDPDTPLVNVTVTGSSSFQTLVPNASITISGSGGSRTVNLPPAANQFGATTITLTANDGSATSSASFTLTVNAVNDPPTLNAIDNVTISEDAGLQTVNLSGIGTGAPNEAQTLTVTATSSNPSLIPNPAVNYISPNATGTLSFTPVANGNGSAVIAVTVNDGQAANNTVSRAFNVTVNPVNDPPVISSIPNQVTPVNTPINVPFTLSDIDTPVGNVTVTGSSSNPTLVPNGNITFSGSGSSRTVTLQPAAGQSGTTTITLTANDGAATSLRAFTLTVNQPPGVTLTAPSEGSVIYVPPGINLAANAFDGDGTISQVAFYVGGSSIGADTTSPYSILWHPAGPGPYVLTARATDNLGATTISAPVNVTVVQLDRDPGLTGFWKFGEGSGTSAFDSSGQNNTALLASPQWVSGKVGSYALHFDGQAAGTPGAPLITINNANFKVLPPMSRPFTVSLWIYLDSIPNAARGLINSGASPSEGWRLTVEPHPTGRAKLVFWGYQGFRVEGLDNTLQANTWYHVVLAYNGAVGKIYLDSELIGSAIGPLSDNGANLFVGGNVEGLANFAGRVDELKLYNRELSPVEFSLTGHWTFEEGSGATARDTSGYDNNASLYYPTWTAGRIDSGAVAFSGGYGWFYNPNYNTLPPTGKPFTVSLWFNPDALPTGVRLLMGSESAGTSGWRLGVNTTGPGNTQLQFWSTASGGTLFVSGGALLLPGRWYKLTAAYNGAGGYLYLDGQLIASGTGTIVGHTAPIFFGGGISGITGLAAKYDDIRTYRRILNAEEISLRGHWRMDENAGPFAGDSSGQGNHATLSAVDGWYAGKSGFAGLFLVAAQATIANSNHRVLQPTGGPFSLSFWIYPYDVTLGYNALMSCETASDGWRLAIYGDISGTNALRFWSTDNGGTLDFWCPIMGDLGVWQKVDLTFNGGIATTYLNGNKVASSVGAIRGSTGPLKLGGVTGLPTFFGVIDDVKVFDRELPAEEIGPVAKVMWETVLLNSSLNVSLQGYGPPGKPRTFSIATPPTKGTVSVNPSTGAATYTHTDGTKGPDTFTYTVSDGEFITPPTVVSISVVQPHWISTTGSGAKDGSSPNNAWQVDTAQKLDAIWQNNQYYDLFHYAPGTYQTKGWRYEQRGTARHGCKHIGLGTEGNETVLQLVEATGATGEGYIFAPLVCGVGSYVNDFEVHNIVLDCNAEGNPKYDPGQEIRIYLFLSGPLPASDITLRWSSGVVPFSPYSVGHALAYEVWIWDGVSSELTLVHATTSGQPGTMAIPLSPGQTVAYVEIRLFRRGSNVALYSLTEIEAHSGGVNVARNADASAMMHQGGSVWTETAFAWAGTTFAIQSAVDGNPATYWASSSQGNVGAIAVAGNNLKFTNLKVIGFGTKAGTECFPFGASSPSPNCGMGAPLRYGNILVENCLFTEPAPNNSDGLTTVSIVSFPPFTLTNAVVRNCQVRNVRQQFLYSHGFTTIHVEDSLVENCEKGVYFEPDAGNADDIGPVLIRSNLFQNVTHGVLTAFHPNSQFDSITCIGNEVVLDSAGWGVAACDDCISPGNFGGPITNVVVLNNIVRLGNWALAPANPNPRGLLASNIRNAVFGNNLIQLGNGWDLVVWTPWNDLPPGYRRAWFNSRNLAGALLEVQYYNGSGLEDAHQQQWP